VSCDRCEDIHTAQLTGTTDKSCSCNCHTNLGNCTCGNTLASTAPCPIHGWIVTNTTCDVNGCSINLNLNNE